MILLIICTASIGYSPDAVSADSITASAPSATALATSVTSARVGAGEKRIDSSICVATTTGLPSSRQMLMMLLNLRHAFGGYFDAEVATGNHDRVAQFSDFPELRDGRRLLDLGHQKRFVPERQDHRRNGRAIGWQAKSPTGRLQDLAPFPIVVAYIPEDGQIVTDRL